MFLKSGGTLFGLGLFTSFISALFLALSIVSSPMIYVDGAILIALGALTLFLAFFKSTEKDPKACRIFAGILAFIAGFIWFFIPQTYHTGDSYLNRVVIYIIFNAGMCCVIACYWTLVTRRVFGALLASTSFDHKEENLLYIILNLLYAVLLSLVLPATDSTDADIVFSLGLSYSIGIWFLNGFLGLAIGYILTTKAGSTGPTSMAAPISTTSDYDGIN